MLKNKHKILILLGIIGILTAGFLAFGQFYNSGSSALPKEIPKDLKARLIEAVLGAQSSTFVSLSVNPVKVYPGDTMIVTVGLKDKEGIKSVIADMGGIAKVTLELKEGDMYEGTWEGQWLVRDTEERGYVTVIRAINLLDEESSKEIWWNDPYLPTWNSNTVQNKDGSLTTDFRIKWVNYLNEDGEWETINPEFTRTDEGWVVKEAPFIAIAPLYSHGTAYFVSNNRYDIFDKTLIDAPEITQTIQAQDVASNIEGIKQQGDLGFGETTYILYKNAYPQYNADLIYWVHQGKAPRLDKLIRFNSIPTEEITRLNFKITYITEEGTATEIKTSDGVWNKQDTQ